VCFYSVEILSYSESDNHHLAAKSSRRIRPAPPAAAARPDGLDNCLNAVHTFTCCCRNPISADAPCYVGAGYWLYGARFRILHSVWAARRLWSHFTGSLCSRFSIGAYRVMALPRLCKRTALRMAASKHATTDTTWPPISAHQQHRSVCNGFLVNLYRSGNSYPVGFVHSSAILALPSLAVFAPYDSFACLRHNGICPHSPTCQHNFWRRCASLLGALLVSYDPSYSTLNCVPLRKESTRRALGCVHAFAGRSGLSSLPGSEIWSRFKLRNNKDCHRVRNHNRHRRLLGGSRGVWHLAIPSKNRVTGCLGRIDPLPARAPKSVQFTYSQSRPANVYPRAFGWKSGTGSSKS